MTQRAAFVVLAQKVQDLGKFIEADEPELAYVALKGLAASITTTYDA
jgi:hypothetical protein